MGITVDDALSQPIEELVDAQVLARLDEQERPVREGQGAVTFDLSGAASGGPDTLDFLVTKYPVTDSTGEIVGVGGISIDITERRRSERALQRSQQQVRQLLEAAPDAMIVVDEAGIVQTVNYQTERLFGYTRDELIGASSSARAPRRPRGHRRARRRQRRRAAGADDEHRARHAGSPQGRA